MLSLPWKFEIPNRNKENDVTSLPKSGVIFKNYYGRNKLFIMFRINHQMQIQNGDFNAPSSYKPTIS